MGCHIFNAMYRGLGLTVPKRVRSQTAVPNERNWTSNERVEFEFPGTPFTKGDLKVFWRSGRGAGTRGTDLLGTRGRQVPLTVAFSRGENGVLLLRHGSSPILLPEKKFTGILPPKLEPFGHHNAFLDAILGGDRSQACCPRSILPPP